LIVSQYRRFIAYAALAAGFALALPGDVPGFASGPDLAQAATYKTYPPSHYRPPRCTWVIERYWHKGRWHWRRVWRCQ
jgi:hypothetical protein